MSKQSAMRCAGDVSGLGQLGELTALVPAELVDGVLDATRRGERRVRLLSARAVVYFVLAMALFPQDGYQGVWSHVVAGVGGGPGRFPSASALRQARDRLGVGPLAELFARVRGPIAEGGTRGAWWRGLRVMAWDGTELEVPDSRANAELYGYPGSRRGRAGYPQVRLLALVECGTRAMADCVWGPLSGGEATLAARLARALEPGMLLLADRNFDGFALWGRAAATGAHLLWRANTKRRLLPVLRELPDGSYLSVLPDPAHGHRWDAWRRRGTLPEGHHVRVVQYEVTTTTSNGTRSEPYTLITTLLDPQRHPAAELAALYRERWQIETAFHGLKTTLRGSRTVLRSQSPARIDQELHAYLIVYQLLQRCRHRTALTARIDPDRVSFKVAMRTARQTVIRAATLPAPTTATAIHHALTRELLPPHRRTRVSPRAVKRPVSPFAQRQLPKLRTHGRTTLQATYTITITTPQTPLTNSPSP